MGRVSSGRKGDEWRFQRNRTPQPVFRSEAPPYVPSLSVHAHTPRSSPAQTLTQLGHRSVLAGRSLSPHQSVALRI